MWNTRNRVYGHEMDGNILGNADGVFYISHSHEHATNRKTYSRKVNLKENAENKRLPTLHEINKFSSNSFIKPIF